MNVVCRLRQRTHVGELPHCGYETTAPAAANLRLVRQLGTMASDSRRINISSWPTGRRLGALRRFRVYNTTESQHVVGSLISAGAGPYQAKLFNWTSVTKNCPSTTPAGRLIPHLVLHLHRSCFTSAPCTPAQLFAGNLRRRALGNRLEPGLRPSSSTSSGRINFQTTGHPR